MGKVAIKYRIMPEDTEVDLDALASAVESALSGLAEVKAKEIVPVAFGLKALTILVVVPDEGGASDRVEEAVRGVEGVESIQVEELSLI